MKIASLAHWLRRPSGIARARVRRPIGVCVLSLLLTACAISPPPAPLPNRMCNFSRHDLEVELPASGNTAEAAKAGPAQTMAQVIGSAIAQPTRSDYRYAGPPTLLYLSGGSLHGAFGAGFLNEWQRRRPGGRLPEFRAVTGISTGAILATFAFIGRTDPLVSREGYAIVNEDELLNPIIRRGRGPFSGTNALRVLRHGAVANLEPLRDVLLRQITPEVLDAVADGFDHGRRLLVGVVDMDTGKAVALDLTELAHRYHEERDSTRRNILHDCYVAAIVASSSAPLAATPVFIDNRMYVDGGLRFGTFTNEVGQVLEQRSLAESWENRPYVYVIVNGDLQLEDRCGKADTSLCHAPEPPSGGFYGAHRNWNLVESAGRSVDILVNQNQRMSVERIKLMADLKGWHFDYAVIEGGAPEHMFTMDVPELGAGTMSCADWHALDRDLDHPVQFYPRYMHCMIDYGRTLAVQRAWFDHPG
jgi:predicted acylesterase/phospholipase RssA